MMNEIDFTKCLDDSGNLKPLSECPPGSSGYHIVDSDDFWSNCIAAGVIIDDAVEWFKKVLGSLNFMLPQATEDISFIDSHSQFQIGQCLASSTSNITEGVTVIQTGAKIDFHYSVNYLRFQAESNLLGRDVGSVPPAGYKVMQRDGQVPSRLTLGQARQFGVDEKLIPQQIKDSGDDSAVWQICPKEPTNYRDALATCRTNDLYEAVASFFKTGSVVPIKSYEKMRDWLLLRQGFLSTCSTWKSSFDSNSNTITSFSGGGSGGHAYGTVGVSTQKFDGEPGLILNNSWGSGSRGGERTSWGDEGMKVWAPNAIRQYLQDRNSICAAISDMKLSTAKPRKVDWTQMG